MLYFWVNILFMADDEGCLSVSLYTLASRLRLSIQQVRTCLNNIESNTLATHQSTHLGTKITICNFDSYKDVQHTDQHTYQHTLNTPSNTPEKENFPLSPDGFLSDSLSLTPYNPPKEKEKEGDADASPKKRGKPVSAPSEFDFVMKLWNDSAKRNIPKIRGLTPARKEKVRLRIKEMGGMEEARTILAECFKKISESDFCNGTAGKWTATFDWFFDNEKNWMKVMEGNYDNKRQVSRFEQSMDVAQKAKGLIGLIYGSSNERTADGFADTPDEQ